MKLTNADNTPITENNNAETLFVTSLANAKITCKGKVTAYYPNATTNGNVKFSYTASNNVTVTLTIVSGVDTWS